MSICCIGVPLCEIDRIGIGVPLPETGIVRIEVPLLEEKMWNWENKYEAQNTYDRTHTTQFKLKVNCKTEADILQWLRNKKKDSNSSIQGAIKDLIRKQIALENKEEDDHATLNR